MFDINLLREALSFFIQRFPEALFTTIYVTLGASAIGMILGLLLALLRASSNNLTSKLAISIINIVRVIPIPPFLYLVYFGTLILFFPISPELAGMFALGFLLSPVMAELYRSGIQSVNKGYIEVSEALGMSTNLIRRRVVFPIALRIMLPAIGQKIVGTLLDSAFVSVLGGRDITGVGRKVVNTLFATQLYFVIAGIYFAIAFPLSRILSSAERKLKMIF